MYAYMRRQALQEYLKHILKIPGMASRSAVLQQFLDLDKNGMNAHYESFGSAAAGQVPPAARSSTPPV
jgi:hypothetical protein